MYKFLFFFFYCSPVLEPVDSGCRAFGCSAQQTTKGLKDFSGAIFCPHFTQFSTLNVWPSISGPRRLEQPFQSPTKQAQTLKPTQRPRPSCDFIGYTCVQSARVAPKTAAVGVSRQNGAIPRLALDDVGRACASSACLQSQVSHKVGHG